MAPKCCIICSDSDAPIIWFNSIYFCEEDNNDFTKRYFDAVIAPKVEGLESPEVKVSSDSHRRWKDKRKKWYWQQKEEAAQTAEK